MATEIEKWSKLNSENDLPQETGRYFVFRNGVVDIGFYSKPYKRWICSGQYYHETFQNLKITHYQLCVFPEPPSNSQPLKP